MCFIFLIFHFFSCVLHLFIFLNVSSCFFSCVFERSVYFILFFVYFVVIFFLEFFPYFSLPRSLDFPSRPKTQKKRREFPIGGSSPCGKAGLAPCRPSIVSFLLFCVLTWEVDKLNSEVPARGLRWWCLLGVSGFLPTSLGDEGLQDLGWQKVSFGFKLLSEDWNIVKLNLINLLSKVRFKSSLGSKMVFVGFQWVFSYFTVGWNHSRPQPWGIWSSRLGVAKGFIWF